MCVCGLGFVCLVGGVGSNSSTQGPEHKPGLNFSLLSMNTLAWNWVFVWDGTCGLRLCPNQVEP